MLQFSCRFAFLSTFCLSNRTPKIMPFSETQCMLLESRLRSEKDRGQFVA